MQEKRKNKKIITLLLITGAVYFFLAYLTPLLAPVLLAMLFVTMFGPILKEIQKKLHIHRQIGAILLLLAACILLILLLWIFFSWGVGSLPNWSSKLPELESDLGLLVHNVCSGVGKAIGIDSSYLETTMQTYLQENFDYLEEKLLPGMLSQSWKYMKELAAVGGFLITFIIASILLAKDYDRIMNKLLDREEYHLFLEIICGIIRYLATYIKAQLIIMSLISALSAAVLAVSGIEHGILWGILAGILDALPFIGTGIVLVPLAISSLFKKAVPAAVICIILYAACAFLREMLEPRLIGRKVGVPAIAILISLYAGLQLFGLSGIIKGPLGFIIVYQTWHSIAAT